MRAPYPDFTFKDATHLICKWSRDKEIVVDDMDRYTGRRLDEEASAFAQALIQVGGIRQGDVAAFMGIASCRFFAAWFGAHRCGAVTCNIHVKESAQFIAATLNSIDAQVLVCSDGLEELARQAIVESGREVILFSLGDDDAGASNHDYRSLVSSFPATPPRVSVSPDDLALIILSSGSTGVPKGIVHSHKNFVGWLHASVWLFGAVDRNTRFLVNVGTSFAAWPFSAIPPLFGGGSVILMEGFTPEGFCQRVEAERVTMAGPVPTMIRLLVPEITQQYDLSSFKMVLCAGEPPSPADIERVLSWADTDIRCLYLASESAPGAATFWSLRDREIRDKAVCAGRPIPGADVRVVDPEGEVDESLPAHQEGEIVLTGPTIANGYLNNPELTNERFVDGWWRSGDLGFLDDDGYLHVTGRIDNVINTGGIKVTGEEVEHCLLAHPDVQQAAVVGVADARWGQRIVAHIVGSSALDTRSLASHCEAYGLAAFKRPKEYFFHDSLPVGITGKLDRIALRELRSDEST